MFYKLLNLYVQKLPFPRRGLKYFLKMIHFLGIADKVYQKRLPEKININLKPSEHIQQQLFWYGKYEKSLGVVLKKLLGPDSTFIDIGANIGYFSLLAAKAAPESKIAAFEPVSYLFDALENNIALNNFKNIQSIKIAIGEKEEDRTIYLSGGDNAGMSSFHKPENYSGKSEIVKVITLDSWFAGSGLTKVDIIKIDVEGNELYALKGMKEIITRFKPYILLELNPETLAYFGLTTADVLNFALQFSYKHYIITEPGKLKELNAAQIITTVNVALVHAERLESVSNLLQ
jgi:FkbM family methyltransferase